MCTTEFKICMYTICQFSMDTITIGVICLIFTQSKCMKAKGSSDRRKWRNEMKTLRTELKKREEVRKSVYMDGLPIYVKYMYTMLYSG